MSTEVHSITDIYKPSKQSTLTKLRKAQSTSKLRSQSNFFNNNTINISTGSSSNISTNNQHHNINHHHHSFIPLKKKKKNNPITSYSSIINNNNNNNNNNSNNSNTTTKPIQQKKKSNTITNTGTTTTTSSTPGFFKKISNEWSSFLNKIKSISEEVFNVDDLIDDLFINSEIEDSSDLSYSSFDKLINKNYNSYNNSTEEKFLQDYKKFKNLDNMYTYYNQPHSSPPRHSPPPQQQQGLNDVGSSTTVVSDQQSFNIRSTLQDVIRHHQNQYMNTQDNYLNLNNISSDSDSIDDMEREDSDNEDEDLITATGSSNHNDIQFNDIDFTLLRAEFETVISQPQQQQSIDKSIISNNLLNQINVGSTLWNYRRSKWLIPNKSPKDIEEHLKNSSIAYIPKDQYYKIYLFLIDKNKQLKSKKYLNLKDLIKIIHIGWIAEKRWEQ
ncbi:hypothetical protein KGF54_004715 [Candida jiufengensis]|uniref:uncharacterized protein n=1 Tax=Candida jiufengensis TaxID=497108 RepID=UPI002225A55F|nr:uncharacterized protein KGF54_004715 [Candida jiufengensis]KAI5951641.1 hypothetical protein KGF54_004715 [Candida jiufengensis]